MGSDGCAGALPYLGTQLVGFGDVIEGVTMQEQLDEVTGLGPLEPLLKDDSVNDILVNGPHQIFSANPASSAGGSLGWLLERRALATGEMSVS